MNNITQKLLRPGVRLTCLQTDRFKTDYISLNLLRPLRAEEASFAALLPSVLLRGTEQYPDMQSICARLDMLYGMGIDGTSGKRGEVQILGLYMDFIDDALVPDGSAMLEPAVDFLTQVLLHPVLENGLLRTDYVEGEKTNLINAIESQINDKRSWATKRMVETMFAGEAYSVNRLGTSEQARSITAESLTAYWQRVLAHSEIEIFFVGRASAETAQRALELLVNALPQGETDAFGTELVLPERPLQECSEVMDVTQGKLVMGLRTPDIGASEDFPALVMCNAIFGGTVSSKLFLNVREAMSLCYYASSGLEKFKGVMIVSAGVDCDRYETARDAILRELEACRSGDITEAEMDAARRSLISSLRAAGDSPDRMVDHYLNQRLLGLEGAPTEMIAKLEAVTKDEVAAAARRLRLDTIYFVKGAPADA